VVYTTNFGSSLSYVEGTVRTTLANYTSGVAVDAAGNVYVTGTAYPGSIPMVNAVQSTCPAGHCAFVTKLSPDGKTILYSTFVGSPADALYVPLLNEPPIVPAGISCDPAGNVYVTGKTEPSKLPQVSGGAASSKGNNDAFVVKLDTNGVLRATMLIGGSGDDEGYSISLGPDGYLYVAGTTLSSDFPIVANPTAQAVSQPPGMFILKINPMQLNGDTPASRAVLYSTVFGVLSPPAISPAALAVDAQSNAYVAASDCGNCAGYNLAAPGTGALVRINASGTQATNLAIPSGSGATVIAGLAVDAEGFVYLTGTTSSRDFPTTPGAFITSSQPAQGVGFAEPFLCKFRPTGSSVVYSTYLSGDGDELVYGIAVDSAGNAYVSGFTGSTQFPVLNSIQSGLTNAFCYGYLEATDIPVDQFYCGQSAGFVTVVKPDGSGLVWSTLLPGPGGSVAMDASGNVYVAATGVNAASFHTGLPFPGGLASMFVHGLNVSGTAVAPGLPLPTELEGISIQVAGVPAPILSVSNVGPTGAVGSQQINFQVPFGTPGDGSIASVTLLYQGDVTTASPVRVAPGIFTLADGSGAIQHASDFSLVTADHPAQKGEVVVVYMTGLGNVSPPVATGAAATGPAVAQYCYSPPTANLGSVLYAGITPGFPGLYQMNILISPSTPSGANPLTITWVNCWVRFDGTSVVPANDSTSNTVMLPVQ